MNNISFDEILVVCAVAALFFLIIMMILLELKRKNRRNSLGGGRKKLLIILIPILFMLTGCATLFPGDSSLDKGVCFKTNNNVVKILIMACYPVAVERGRFAGSDKTHYRFWCPRIPFDGTWKLGDLVWVNKGRPFIRRKITVYNLEGFDRLEISEWYDFDIKKADDFLYRK